MHSFPLIFLWFIYQNENRALTNDLDVILNGFMLQIIYITVSRSIVEPFNSENPSIYITKNMLHSFIWYLNF